MGLTKKRTKINFRKEGKHGGSDGGLAPKSSPTPATPWTVAARLLCPWDFRQEYWRGMPFPSPQDLPNPEIEPASPALQVVSCIASGFFTAEPPGKPKVSMIEKTEENLSHMAP